MDISRYLALACTLMALTACGGGGGSSSPDSAETPSTGGSPGGDDPGDDGEVGEGSNPPNGTSEAEITFPAAGALATRSLTVIRGVARDDEGISEVLVNGVSASVVSTQAAGQGSWKSDPSLSLATGSADTEVQWTAQVQVAPGDNEVSVTVTDGQGNTTSSADTTTLSYLDVPIEFSLDADRNRVIGISSAYTSEGHVRRLLAYDYLNDIQTVLMDKIDSYEPSCYRPDTQEFYHVLFEAGNTLVLHSYQESTDSDMLVMSTQVDPASEGYVDAIYTGNLVCGSGNDSVYLLLNYADPNNSGFAKSTILEFDVADDEVRVLTETDPAANPTWLSNNIALTSTGLISLAGQNWPLTLIDLQTGTRSELTPGLGVDAFVLAEYSTTDFVYAVDFEGVHEIDVANRTSTNRSVVDESDPYAFSQFRRVAFDSENNRVIVSDSDLDSLIAVDLDTGERSELLARSVGAGAKMIAPRAMAISADMTKAYIADDGGNVAEKLFEVDLTTGNRVQLGDLSSVQSHIVAGLAIDEANGLVYVAFNDEIVEVNIESGLVTTIASNSVGSGLLLSGVSAVLLDSENDRLLLADAVEESVLAIDLSTQERTLVSSEGAKGDGPGFQNINSIAFSADKQFLYASNQLGENIMSVELATGNRQLVLDECLDNSGSNVLGVGETLMQVLMDVENDRLLIRGDNILSLELADNSCSVLQDFDGTGLLDLQFGSPEHLFAVAFKSLGQYDLETGDFVIISK